MRHKLSIDFETFSRAEIRKTGSYRYILDPSFDILLCAWALDDEPVDVIDLTTKEGRYFFETTFREILFGDDVEIHAYNAAFELMCIARYFDLFPLTAEYVHRFRCTMVHGMYCGYTSGLEITGEVLGLPSDKRKLSIGKQLIRKFCVPAKPTLANPTRDRIYPEDEPEKWKLFVEYCRQDVETEREIERRLSHWPMPDREQQLWELDILGNYRGVGVDMELVHGAIDLNERNTQELLEEAGRITGLENPNSVQQLLTWLTLQGVDAETLRKEDVKDLLDGDVSDDVRRVLEIRQQLCKTSCKKYDAIVAAVCDDGRVRGLTQFYGANRTGRYAGRLVQVQNLPQNHIDDLAGARELVKTRDAGMLRLMYGDSVPDTLSQLIRTAFVPRDGHAYAIADFSAIECRVIAALSGEKWVLDAFREGKDIYCATASQMFGVPVEKHGQNSHLRQRGKVAVLALGYAGGVNALIAMGALKMGIPEEDLEGIKTAWRKANPNIVKFWRTVGDAAYDCIKNGNEHKLPCGVTFRLECDPPTAQRFMTVELPSGRKLFYAHPNIGPSRFDPTSETLMYYGMNQVTRKWEIIYTHAGKLVENIVQAVARDILCDVLLKLNMRGFIPVFHVHDEVIVEVPQERREDGLEMILRIMAETPRWVRGDLPLKGAGFTTEFYQKD